MRHRFAAPRAAPALVLALLAPLLVAALLTASCHSLGPERLAGSLPRFEPEKFFAGTTRSWGVVEDRFGHPRSRFRADMVGHQEGAELVVTQDFTFEDGRRQRRVFRLRRIDEHRYEATANDMIGVSTGFAYGNTFHWEYTVALHPGNPLTHVRFRLWMYLQADGETVVNRVRVTKLGIVVAATTEYFHRGSGPLPSIAPGSQP